MIREAVLFEREVELVVDVEEDAMELELLWWVSVDSRAWVAREVV